MAQTPATSRLKLSPKKRKKKPVIPEITISPEEAASYKGRIPSGVKDQVLYLNEQKRQEKKQLLRQDKNGAIVQQRKLDAFFDEFLRNGGNATDAAAKIFNVSSRASASTIGSVYLKKCKSLGRVYLEQHGYTFGRALTTIARKAEESRLPDWMDRYMGIAGYDNPGASSKAFQGPTTNINIVQAEKEIFKKYMAEATEAEVVMPEHELQEDTDDDQL